MGQRGGHAGGHDERRGGRDAGRGGHGAAESDFEEAGRVVLGIEERENMYLGVEVVEGALVAALEVERPVVLGAHGRFGVDGERAGGELRILGVRGEKERKGVPRCGQRIRSLRMYSLRRIRQ